MYVPDSFKPKNFLRIKPVFFFKECYSDINKRTQAETNSHNTYIQITNKCLQRPRMFTKVRNHYNSLFQKPKIAFNNPLRDKVLFIVRAIESFRSLAKNIDQILDTSGFFLHRCWWQNNLHLKKSRTKSRTLCQTTFSYLFSPPDDKSVYTIQGVLCKMLQISFIDKYVRKFLRL